jgi:hypothetical protein
MGHPRGIQELIVEHNEKCRAARGIAPTPEQWADNQPERWKLICQVFAVNINVPGGITGKTITDIVKTAKARGVTISRRTLVRWLPELERYGVVCQERQFDWSTDEVRRKPSAWLIDLRKAMPSHLLPLHDALDLDASNAAWLEAHGLTEGIDSMNARIAAQAAQAPF